MKKEKIKIFSYPRIPINFSPKIPPLKRGEEKTKINVRYCLISPYAFVHIYWDPKIYELVYEIEEPVLNKEEMGYKEQLISAMRDLINFDRVIKKDEEELKEYIDTRFKFLATEFGMEISYESYKKIYYYLCRDFIGFNEIEPLLRDYYVEVPIKYLFYMPDDQLYAISNNINQFKNKNLNLTLRKMSELMRTSDLFYKIRPLDQMNINNIPIQRMVLIKDL